MYYIGIDLGGTKLSGVLCDKKGKLLKRARIELREKTKESISGKILEIISSLSATVGTKRVSSIGIGVPGSFSNGKITILPNLHCLNGFELKKSVEKRFSIKTFIEKDSNCFVFGEAFLRKKQNLAGITLGTGFGGGIVIDGKIYNGLGSGGEFGHMTIVHDGRKCSCGNRGCLEQYASGQGLEQDSKNVYGEPIKAENLVNMARKGDRTAIGIFENFGYYLGIGLANINYVLNPEMIVIGGGISNCSDLYLKRAIEEMKKRTWIEIPKILISKNDGALGAALVAMQGRK
jgi:glucokinase